MQDPKALLGIVLLPLLGAILNGVLGRRASRQTVHFIAVVSVAMSFAIALVMFKHLLGLRAAGEPVVISYTAYEWFSLTYQGKPIGIPVRFVMDELSGVMTLVVTGIGLLIHVYSTAYMSEEKSYARFFSYLNLFTASMLILILGSNLPLMFVGWEGVGVCSYLLIGFWFENPAYARAGRKAFVVNRIGDFGVLIGMFLLVTAAGSFEFDAINQFATSSPGVMTSALQLGPTGAPYLIIPGVSLAAVATLFLFLGCTGKSAQLPLYVWLPDAMAGPTPVSALIHAATMVTSGIYLICRLSPVFVLAPYTMATIAIVGAVTALLAASVGLVQNDIKKILAYSTVSQLGFMFAAVGCGAFAAGFMHVYTHAFFKACLFLGAGSVMHAVGAHGDADIRTLGGLRKYMPHTRWTFLVSCMAIAGVPLFSGFFSKDEILVGALTAAKYFQFAPWIAYLVFGMLFVCATMTAFYMFRLYFLTFSGDYRGGPHHDDHGHGDHGDHGEHAHHDPHESPGAMTVPLAILGFGAIFAGYVWVGLFHFEPWVHWLQPVLGTIDIEIDHNHAYVATAVGSVACLVGWLTAYNFYFKGSDTPKKLAATYPGLHRLLMDKWRVDEFYDATVLAFSRGLAGFSAGFDKHVVDGLVASVTSQSVALASFVATRLQTGLVHAYSAVMVAGMLGVAFYFVVPHVTPEVTETDGVSVKLDAGKGFGYRYRWDFDGDGVYDTEWSDSAAAEHTFQAEQLEHAFVAVFEGAAYGAAPVVSHIARGDELEVCKDDLGALWQSGQSDKLPRVVAVEDGFDITPNGARVRKDGELQAPNEKVRVGRGEHVNIGEARLTVTGLVRPSLQVQNAFGMERVRSFELVLPQVEARTRGEVAGVTVGGAP
jgi:NADH-quinone oxidoreductase subunit L